MNNDTLSPRELKDLQVIERRKVFYRYDENGKMRLFGPNTEWVLLGAAFKRLIDAGFAWLCPSIRLPNYVMLDGHAMGVVTLTIRGEWALAPPASAKKEPEPLTGLDLTCLRSVKNGEVTGMLTARAAGVTFYNESGPLNASGSRYARLIKEGYADHDPFVHGSKRTLVPTRKGVAALNDLYDFKPKVWVPAPMPKVSLPPQLDRLQASCLRSIQNRQIDALKEFRHSNVRFFIADDGTELFSSGKDYAKLVDMGLAVVSKYLYVGVKRKVTITDKGKQALALYDAAKKKPVGGFEPWHFTLKSPNHYRTPEEQRQVFNAVKQKPTIQMHMDSDSGLNDNTVTIRAGEDVYKINRDYMYGRTLSLDLTDFGKRAVAKMFEVPPSIIGVPESDTIKVSVDDAYTLTLIGEGKARYRVTGEGKMEFLIFTPYGPALRPAVKGLVDQDLARTLYKDSTQERHVELTDAGRNLLEAINNGR